MTTISSAVAPRDATENRFVALPRFPSACTALFNRLSDAFWEKRLRLHTAGRCDVPHADAVHYEPLPYYAVGKILRRLAPTANDVLVDIGSGMGRTVCVAATLPLREVRGVEIEPALHAIAEANAARLRGRRAPIALRRASATEFDYRDATVLWIFNPFGAATMRAVLARIAASLRERPRPLRIAYINATCAHLFAAQPWLACDGAWEMSTWSRVKTPVRFYHATG